MGTIKRILVERRIGRQGYYPDHARLELAENVHLHWRDLRLVMSITDMLILRGILSDGVSAWETMGRPESLPEFKVLDENRLRDEGYHADRLAVEEQDDGSVHIHYRDLRIHLMPADMLLLARQLRWAMLEYIRSHVETVDITTLNRHSIVETYLRWLKERELISPTIDVEELGLLIRQRQYLSRLYGLARPNGLPDDTGFKDSRELDRRYLFAIADSIKEFGYGGDSPYGYDYLVVYRLPDGSLYCKDSHRLACLLHLGIVENKASAVVVDAESGWQP